MSLGPGGMQVIEEPVMEVPDAVTYNPSVQGIRESTKMTCPSCQANMSTETNCFVTTNQLLCCAILFFLTPFFCFTIPFCIPGCYGVEHKCSACQHAIGKSNKAPEAAE